MPDPIQFVSSQALASTSLPTTVETVVASIVVPIVTPQAPTVSIEANMNILVGTAGTGLTLRIRRDSLTGAVVGNAQSYTLAAGATQNVSVCADDNPGEESTRTYVVTVAQVAATGSGTCNQANVYGVCH